MMALLLNSMKVYAIIEQREDYEVGISKVFSSRKKARKYIYEKYYAGCDLKDAKTINGVDGWISIVELE